MERDGHRPNHSRIVGMGIATSEWKGYFGSNPRLYQHMSEGYGTGEYYIDHLTLDNLRELADWMIGLPPDQYAKIEGVHRHLEWWLVTDGGRHK